MGLKAPRGKFERLDILLPARIWRTRGRQDPVVAATCRNLSARGCRLRVEDVKRVPGFDVESPIYFSIRLHPLQPELVGCGQVVWFKRERGEEGKIRSIFGIEFTDVSFSDRERIKGFILIRGRSI